MTKTVLGGFEEIVLLSVLKLGADAYGVKIRQCVEEATERPTSVGAIYATLDRLERKGFVSSIKGEPTVKRGGRAKRYFKVNASGVQALNEAATIRNRMILGRDFNLEIVR
jgi:DNA-binding PadR family transcriptional regulator